MKRTVFAILLFMCVALLFSCSANTGDISTYDLQMLKNLYRNSTAVVRAVCVDFSTEKSTAVFKNITNIAGKVSSEFILEASEFEKQGEYLIFLVKTNDAGNYSKDNYTAVQIKKDRLLFNEHKLDINSVIDELKTVSNTISINSSTYFYTDRHEFLKNAETIVIGKVISELKREKETVRLTTSGIVMERKQDSVTADISVVATLKGSYNRGDTIRLLYIPDQLSSMIDANTFSTVAMSELDIQKLNNKTYYLFFLISGQDKKQNYCFPINPAQGWNALSGDNIVITEKEEIFDDCNTLPDLLKELKNSEG